MVRTPPRRNTQPLRRTRVEVPARDPAVRVRQAVVPVAQAQPGPPAVPVQRAAVLVAQAKLAAQLALVPVRRVVLTGPAVKLQATVPAQPLAIVPDKLVEIVLAQLRATVPVKRAAIAPAQLRATVPAQPLATEVAQAPLAGISPLAAATFPSGVAGPLRFARMDRFARSMPTE